MLNDWSNFLPPVYRVGDEITWACNNGYEARGSSKAVCTESGTWSEELLTCRRVTCGPPSYPDHVIVDVMEFLYGSTANYSCHEGYVMQVRTYCDLTIPHFSCICILLRFFFLMLFSTFTSGCFFGLSYVICYSKLNFWPDHLPGNRGVKVWGWWFLESSATHLPPSGVWPPFCSP